MSIPKSVIDWTEVLPVGKPLAYLESKFVLATLRHCGYNRTHTAKMLGISLRTVHRLIKSYREDGVAIPDNPTASNPHPMYTKVVAA